MSSLWNSKGGEQEISESIEPLDDVADAGQVVQSGATADRLVDSLPAAPALPPPAQQSSRALPLRTSPPQDGSSMMMPPPPAASALPPSSNNQSRPFQQQQQPQHAPSDSLSLMQLRRIVAEANRAEPAAYDFVYSDMGPHAEEIDEWFVYQFWQWVRLNAAQKAFEWHWTKENGGNNTWDDADHDTRMRFIQAAIAGVRSDDAVVRSEAIGKLVYLVLGRWGDTAMPHASDGESRSIASLPQLQAINAGVTCLSSLEGLPVVWKSLRTNFEAFWSGDIQESAIQEAQDELYNLLTILYIAIQETLNDPEDMSPTYQALLELKPPLVNFMLLATSKLRWDEQALMPHTQVFQLFWKSILLVFGGTKDLQRIKEAISETSTGEHEEQERITASPLDYHAFRQEITSKYPAYIPPQPLIPLEADNISILPTIPSMFLRNAGNGIIPQPPNVQMGGASILNQPVHIATPAPSPPPSPGIGGKGGKKQNYQTNQNFPFMYPPLDATSNSAGGKGMVGIDDDLVSRRWEGSDIPASILEAGQIFSSRVRMTRATRQLWEERERFLKSERGWDADDDANNDDDNIEFLELGLDLEGLTLEEKEILRGLGNEKKEKEPRLPSVPKVDFGPQPEKLTERDKQRISAIESFYCEALPHLQSLVIVLLRPILVNVTAIVTQQQQQQSQQQQPQQQQQQQQQQPGPMGAKSNNTGNNMPRGPGGPGSLDANGQGPVEVEQEPSPEEVDASRTREITAKAMTAILILLLKWLRLSHVLKFEYLTQLLLDSNYLPLVLKLFAHQDIQQVVDSKMDRIENSFFQFCNLRSKFKDKAESSAGNGNANENEHEAEQNEERLENVEQAETQDDGDSEDEAVPPPIRRAWPQDETGAAQDANVVVHDGQTLTRPEVDELGCPVNSLPAEPITDFSRRNFFSLINYLRVMQKICKGKAHRNLLLVQYKSSNILRKSLRVPQPELRLYTLKLFKGQVPYCGRKWRQSNMRVITAVYLHCRPELRDEWLAGSDIDAEVDSALPLEQALRGLTHWLNVKRYPEKIATEIRVAMREEQDFFTRELEKLDMNWAELLSSDDGMSNVKMDQGDVLWG